MTTFPDILPRHFVLPEPPSSISSVLGVHCVYDCTGDLRKRTHTKRYVSFLAETVGFEPTCGCPQTDFESESLSRL